MNRSLAKGDQEVTLPVAGEASSWGLLRARLLGHRDSRRQGSHAMAIKALVENPDSAQLDARNYSATTLQEVLCKPSTICNTLPFADSAVSPARTGEEDRNNSVRGGCGPIYD